MADVPFKLYPRGFLGAVLEGHIEKQFDRVETGLGWRDMQALTLRNQNDIRHGNRDVETLYAQQINRSANITSFEFKKSVLQVALRAFGTQMFDFWYQMQFKSPAAGQTHRQFLDDTLLFITSGRREVAIETWQALLEMEDPKLASEKLSERANEFFGFSSNGITRYPSYRNLTEVIQRWCSQPNGLEDLLCTLHVLFGNM